MKRPAFTPLAQLVTFLALAVVFGAVANSFGPPKRRLAWRGDYPNALVVPSRPADTPAITPSPALPTPAAVEPPAAAPTASSGARPAPLHPAAITSAAPIAAPAAAPTSAPAAAAAKSAAPPAAEPAFSFPPHPEKPWVEIDFPAVRYLYTRKAPFIDARRTDDYVAGHIAGARSMPIWEADVDARVAAFYEEGHDADSPIVVYCSGGNCEDSHMLAQKLWGLGFENVLVYKGGFPDWQKQGGAVQQGAR